MLVTTGDPLYRLYLTVRAINDIIDDRTVCFYCGDTATCEDHVIPHSFLFAEGVNRRNYEVDTVPSCKECNLTLGSNIYDTLAERLQFLEGEVCRKHSKKLAHQKWSEPEIRELAGRLRAKIRLCEAERQWAEARLNNLKRPLPEMPAASIYETPDEKGGQNGCKCKETGVKPCP